MGIPIFPFPSPFFSPAVLHTSLAPPRCQLYPGVTGTPGNPRRTNQPRCRSLPVTELLSRLGLEWLPYS